MRSCEKLKEATHSGAGSVKIGKYIYSDKLRFLQKLTIDRSTERAYWQLLEKQKEMKRKQQVRAQVKGEVIRPPTKGTSTMKRNT
jgi:hypothetical protein